MAESIVFNNATYIIPDPGESNWGQNLTNYFVAIPQGCYQLSGGTKALTADLSFGSNFGIFAKYFTSVTSTPATAGAVRLAKTDAVEWMNNAGGGNLALAINASDQLTFNGNIIPTDAAAVTAKSFLYGDAAGLIASTANPTNGQLLIGSTGAIPVVAALTGTSNEIIVTNGAGTITLSTPQAIGTASSPTFDHITLAKTTNQIILGTTNTTTLSATAPASSRVYTIPDAGGAANVVLDAGSYTIAGTWVLSSVTSLTSAGTNPATAGVIRLAKTEAIEWRNNANGANLTLATDTSDRLLWGGNVIAGSSGLSITGTSNQITVTPSSTTITLSTPQDIAAASTPTFAALTLTNTTNQLVLGTTRTATITAPTPATSSRTYTFPDMSANYSVVATEGAQTINGAKTFTANLVVDATKAGALLILGAQNDSNTASSDAAVYANVAGTSGGDAYFQASISGSTIWLFGLDNSDSDAFVISNSSSLGTTNRLRIDVTTGGVAIQGTSTNDNAAAGFVGEAIKGGPTAITNSTAGYTTITSITLTAGDWDLSFVVTSNAAAATIEAQAGIATATNTSTGYVLGDNECLYPVSATFDGSGCVAGYRLSISAGATYYLTAKAFGGNHTITGRLSARRVR